MRAQMTTLDGGARKRLYDRVQAIAADKLPIIPLVSPNIIVAAKRGVGNFRPALLDHYTLWNVEQLFWRAEARRGRGRHSTREQPTPCWSAAASTAIPPRGRR